MRTTLYILITGLLFLACIPEKSGAQDTQQIPAVITDSVVMGRTIAERYLKASEAQSTGDSLLRGNNPVAALEYWLLALYEYEQIGDTLRINELRTKCAGLFEEHQLYDKALEYRRAVLKLSVANNDLKQAKENLSQMILVALKKGEPELADSLLKQLEELCINVDSDCDNKHLLAVRLSVLNATHQWEKALEMTLEAENEDWLKNDAPQQIYLWHSQSYLLAKLGRHNEALKIAGKAAKLEKTLYGYESLQNIINRAILLFNTGSEKEAVAELGKYPQTALKPGEKAELLYLQATMQYSIGNIKSAEDLTTGILSFDPGTIDPELLLMTYRLKSKIYESGYDFESAVETFHQYLEYRDRFEQQKSENRASMARLDQMVARTENEVRELWNESEKNYLEIQRLKLDSATQVQKIQILRQSDSIRAVNLRNQLLENERIRQQLLIREQQAEALKKAREVDSLRNRQRIQQLELEKEKLASKQQADEIVLLQQENEIKDLRIQKVRTRNYWLAGISLLALVILYLVWRGLRYARKTNKILSLQNNEILRQKDEINRERQRSEDLLLNILPEKTAAELKESGKATPKFYKEVSVLFTDFKGFTGLAEKLSPEELVEQLNHCFTGFDRIISRYGLEKIKTIGDAYMCAGGLPEEMEDHAVRTVAAALEIRDFMKGLKEEHQQKGMPFWEIRIGIHSGPVVAGVVGRKKFAYDIWGDTVNTASRMESSGIPGEVNISEATWEKVKEHFECIPRGMIEAKNKGKISMYLVKRRLKTSSGEPAGHRAS
ncbi:MAG: hypothetical protein Kow00127_19450 [Bacteroidales bacterium]